MSDWSARLIRDTIVVTIGFAIAIPLVTASESVPQNLVTMVVILIAAGWIVGTRNRPDAGGIALGAIAGGLIIAVVGQLAGWSKGDPTQHLIEGLLLYITVAYVLTAVTVLPGYLFGRAAVKAAGDSTFETFADAASPGLLAAAGLGIVGAAVGSLVWFVSALSNGLGY